MSDVMRAYTIRLTAELVEAFDAKARQCGKTRSEVLRELMLSYVEDDEKDTRGTRKDDVESVLRDEIDVLKEQNAVLRAGLVKVHDQLTQAQAVSFVQAQALQQRFLEDRTHRRWWQFWK